MTDEELHQILTNLTHHLEQLDSDRATSGLNPPAGSGNGGKAPTGGKPKLPCSGDLLEWERTLAPELSEAAEELCATYPGQWWPTPRQDPHNPHRPNTALGWCRWLNHPRHRPLILQMGQWDPLDQIIRREEELRHMLHPTDPHQQAVDLAGIVTIDLLKQQGIKAGTIRSWKSRGVLQPVGTQRLSSGEVLDIYRIERR